MTDFENKEYSSDSDESDEDYKPIASGSEPPSEEESDCGEDADDQHDNSKSKCDKKPRTKKSNTKKTIEKHEDELEENVELNEEDEKKRADALWADFLNDTGTKSSQDSCASASNTSNKSNGVLSKQNSNKSDTLLKNDDKNEETTVTEVHDFLGEKVLVTKKVETKPTVQNTNEVNVTKASPRPSNQTAKRPAGGISSILGQINKKNKLTVLEKTKLDWDKFKSTEGLSEELKNFNRGRDGYLERQDFLERTDLKQFEIEKSLRQNKRSTR